MVREFAAFPSPIETSVRSYIARHCRFPGASDHQAWLLQGARLKFYGNTWLGYLEPAVVRETAARIYFLVRLRPRSNTVAELVSIANQPGAVERANRKLQLQLYKEDMEATNEAVLDYLSFYYAFTPQQDPISANLKAGPTQFAVPQAFADLQFQRDSKVASQVISESFGEACSEPCLARGAVWHFLDDEAHEHVMALRFKRKLMPYRRFTGRLPIQFQDAIFAVDFRLPADTGVPVLSNPELLYQSELLLWPIENPSITLLSQNSITEFWLDLKKEVRNAAFGLGSAVLTLISWLVTALFIALWTLSALFPIAEMTGRTWMRDLLHYLSRTLGLAAWPETLFGLTLIGVAAFLWTIFYTTHMDRIFNWVFRLSPKKTRAWVAKQLDKRVERRDRDLIAQDTFGKRARWALLHLAYWSGYVVMAFSSLQIASNIIYDQQAASAVRIVLALAEQAALNIPLIFYVLLRIPGLADRIDPVAEGILGETLLPLFHAAMVVVVLKGLYRVWVFTVEASPHAFYRRLRHKSPGRRARVPQFDGHAAAE